MLLDLYGEEEYDGRGGIRRWFSKRSKQNIDEYLGGTPVRTLEAYENRDAKWLMLTTLKDADSVSLPPFDAISFDLSLLWTD